MVNVRMYALLVGQCTLRLRGIGTKVSTFEYWRCRTRIHSCVDYRPSTVYTTSTCLCPWQPTAAWPKCRDRMRYGRRMRGRIRWIPGALSLAIYLSLRQVCRWVCGLLLPCANGFLYSFDAILSFLALGNSHYTTQPLGHGYIKPSLCFDFWRIFQKLWFFIRRKKN
jgi:hypothetical protein